MCKIKCIKILYFKWATLKTHDKKQKLRIGNKRVLSIWNNEIATAVQENKKTCKQNFPWIKQRNL